MSCRTDKWTVNVTQANFFGKILESDDCDSKVAKVTAVSANGPNASFTITGQSRTGTCRALFTGWNGVQTGLAIYIADGTVIDLKAPHR